MIARTGRDDANGGHQPPDDIDRVLHEEIGRLPEKYRKAVVLCYLQGLTHEQAADQLGWPVGTIRRRLAWARDRLRGRLTGRGVAPSVCPAGFLGSGLAWDSTWATLSVPAALADATVRGALRVGLGKAALAGIVSAEAVALMKGVSQTMMITKLMVLTATVLTVGLATTGAGLIAYSDQGQGSTPTPEWVNDQGQPAAGRETTGNPKAGGQTSKDRLDAPPIAITKQTESSPFRFAEIAKDAGLNFVHFSGMTEEKHFPTANGSGVAVFDFDNDGLLDIYFATATLLPLGTAEKGPNRLYKNLGNNRFQDVTVASGLGYRGFCHGIITGDIDNDGDPDVFLCNYGRNVLYLNNGNGTFKDISKSAGIDAPNWSSGGAMLDYDNDGYLDIYVTNYGRWTYPDDHQKVRDAKKKVWLYSSPRTIKTTKHFFYHNNGNLTFADVYDRAIMTEQEVEDPKTKAKTKVRVPNPRADGHGSGVVAADVNNDGLIDLYVANDMNPNFLFLNRGDGTFDDVSEMSGAAFDIKGISQSGKGVDAEDIDGDGLPELFVTNFANEYNTLYQNFGKGVFFDNTAFFGLATDSMPWVGWGCALADFDNDGWPDCFVADGYVDNNRKLLDQPVVYEKIPLLFRNLQGKRFRLSTKDAGTYFYMRHVARGAAFGDIDNDGDIDIVINHKDGAAALLRNDTKSNNHWIRLVLQGTKSNRDAIGTKVQVTAGERTIYRQRKGGYSLQGTNDPRVVVGVGPVKEVKKVVIRWPSGIVSTLENLKVDRDYQVVEPKP